MYGSNVKRIIVFAVLLLNSVTATPAEGKGCDKMMTLYNALGDCKPFHTFRSILSISKYNNHTYTEGSVLQELKTLCSDRRLHEDYLSCADNIATVCHEHGTYIRQISRDYLATFCSGERAADWLRTGLVGLEVALECDVGNELFEVCSSKVLPRYFFSDVEEEVSVMTVVEGEEMFPRLLSDMFDCTVEEVKNQRSDDCASSWQDVLLVAWLHFTAETTPLFNFPQVCVDKFLALKTEV